MTRTAFALAVSALALGFAAPQAAAAAGLGSLYSCDAAGSRNTTGAVVGGIVGGLVGAKIAKDDAVGAVIGAGIGSALGNNIGCRMDRQAAVDAQTAFQRALDTGKPQVWSDPSTGAKGKIEVLGPGSSGGYRDDYAPVANRPWRFATGVQPTMRSGSAGGVYAASGRINVRAAPSTGAEVLSRLEPGERFNVAGAVRGDWLAVDQDGYIQGYVSRSVARSVSGGGGSGGGDCRLVRQTINERGQAPYTQTFNACRDRSGEWQLTTV